MLQLHLRLSLRVIKKEARPEGVPAVGEPEEIRTPDPYNANVMRYQVVKNYAPKITTVRTLISSQNLRKTRIVAYALAI